MEANNIIFLNSPVFYDETNISVMENTIKVIVAKSSYGTKEFEFIFKPYLGEFYHHHLIFSEAEKTRMQLTSHNYYEKCKSTFRYSDGLSNEILEDIFLLEVDKDAISRIPEDVFNLVNLTDLMIENNMIQSISKKIIKLENLVVLSLSNNQLEKLPDKIGALKYLKELHIQNNSTLISLPITFSKLKLQSLSIDGDLLSSQIEIIKNVTSLFSIVINGGTLSKEVLEYLEECYQLQRVEIIAIKNDHIPRVINNLIIREIDYETGALIYN
jgi:Leucine-rich repeat (LRR) protein